MRHIPRKTLRILGLIIIILFVGQIWSRIDENIDHREVKQASTYIPTGTKSDPISSAEGVLMDIKITKSNYIYYRLPLHRGYKTIPLVYRDKDLVLNITANGKQEEWKYGEEPLKGMNYRLIGVKINCKYPEDTKKISITHKKIKK